MNLRFHRRFDKRYAKLTPKLQVKVDRTIERFVADPFDPLLKNHALTGQLLGKRAFSVTGDYRVVFEEYKDYTLVLLLDVGTHNQVYGR